LRSRLARRGDGVAAPQLLAGLGVPAVEEPTGGAIAARHPRDHDAVRHQRRDDAGVALLVVGELLLPELLAGLHVERDDMRVDRLAEELAVVDGRAAARDDAGRADAGRAALVVDGRAPDLLAGGDLERESPVALHPLSHAFV